MKEMKSFKHYMNFTYAASFCETVYGAHYASKEDWFICPECGEPLYFCDNPTDEWNECPVCEFNWFDEAEGEEDDSEY